MSRPRKNIILYCGDEHQMSIYNFSLSTVLEPKFTVIAVKSHEWAQLAIERYHYGNTHYVETAIVIRCHEIDESIAIIHLMNSYSIPVILLNLIPSNDEVSRSNVTAYFPKGTSMADIAQRIRIIAQRKRGPKKKELVAA